MTDRELLEAAAKSVGVPLRDLDDRYDCWETEPIRIHKAWNPLADNGDALWLAVKLRLTISWDRFDDSDYATATPPHTHQGYDCMVDQDPYASTRRAIVLAAAEVRKAGAA